MNRFHVGLIAVSAALVLSSATWLSGAIAGQPSTATSRAAAGEFVWHDLVTDNPTASRAFYSALFGWTFQPGEGIDPGYTIIFNGKRPIAGIVARDGKGGAGSAEWLAYLIVNDVDRAADTIRQAGGRIYRGPLNARKDLRVAAVADAQGAALGLASRGPNFPVAAGPVKHEWLWMEYVARDPDSALKFYGDLAGFTHAVSESRENFTYYVLSTQRPQAGLFRSIWPRETSAWLPYILVDDPIAMAKRATELGGTVVLPPSPRVRNNSLAVVLDPTGAAVALQKYPFDKGATP